MVMGRLSGIHTLLLSLLLVSYARGRSTGGIETTTIAFNDESALQFKDESDVQLWDVIIVDNGMKDPLYLVIPQTVDLLTSNSGTDVAVSKPHLRKKRFIGGVIGSIGRGIGRSLVRAPRIGRLLSGAPLGRLQGLLLGGAASITRAGRRITYHYTKRGGMRQANRDFDRLEPTNVFRIQNGQGRVGKVGEYTVNVRPHSSQGSPTLEYFKTSARNAVTKIRYTN